MAAANWLSPVKQIRTQLGLDRSELAQRLEIPEAKLALWEQSLESATSSELRDLAVALDVTVDTLLGWDEEGEPANPEEAPPTFVLSRYGTLQISFASHTVRYPIDKANRERALQQVHKREVQANVGPSSWLSVETMDNKIVYANLSYVQQIELMGDDAEDMPDYEHPEVYKALENQELDRASGLGPVLRKCCEAVLDSDDAAEIIKATQHARIVLASGEVTWHYLLELADTVGYFMLEVEDGNIPPNRFVRVASEGYYRERFVNLSNVALIEVPMNRCIQAGAGD